MNSNDSKQVLYELADKCINQCLCKLVNTDFVDFKRPTLCLNQRGRIAGAALLQKNILRLQPRLFELNQAYFLSDVIPHELAHLIVYQFFGRTKPHGKEWRYVMEKIFQVPAKVTHSLDLKAAGIKMFAYRCNCSTVELSTVRHNRVQNHRQRYICKACKAPLHYVQQAS